MVAIPTTPASETITPEVAVQDTPVVETKKSKKNKKAAEATTVPTPEGTTPAEPKPATPPKVKGPNDLSAAEARCLALAADGVPRVNAEFYSITTDVLGCATKTGGSPGLVGRGFLEVKVTEPQEGQGGRVRNCYTITTAGRAALALQPDVEGLTTKAVTMELAAKEKFFAKKAAKKVEAPATVVPVEPVAEAAPIA